MNIPKIITRMTLEDKISLCTGGDFWHSKAMKQYGIPAFMMSDGPHGLRCQSGEAEAIGLEAITAGVDVVLGPECNIKRNPLCGRNFEYLSEAPYLAGKLAAAFIRGIQGTGVHASDNRWLLTEVLRKEWGFDGMVLIGHMAKEFRYQGSGSSHINATAAGFINIDFNQPLSHWESWNHLSSGILV